MIHFRWLKRNKSSYRTNTDRYISHRRIRWYIRRQLSLKGGRFNSLKNSVQINSVLKRYTLDNKLSGTVRMMINSMARKLQSGRPCDLDSNESDSDDYPKRKRIQLDAALKLYCGVYHCSQLRHGIHHNTASTQRQAGVVHCTVRTQTHTDFLWYSVVTHTCVSDTLTQMYSTINVLEQYKKPT